MFDVFACFGFFVLFCGPHTLLSRRNMCRSRRVPPEREASMLTLPSRRGKCTHMLSSSSPSSPSLPFVVLSTRRHLQDWNDSHQRHRVETSRISRGHILSHAVRPGRDPLPAEFEIEAQRVLDLGNQDGCHDRSLEARRVNVNGNICNTTCFGRGHTLSGHTHSYYIHDREILSGECRIPSWCRQCRFGSSAADVCRRRNTLRPDDARPAISSHLISSHLVRKLYKKWLRV